ncbi:MAG TPA: glycosyltransferase [Vicinamibacterales bacterium]|nr:glycosyltransferase [Vicinamibacterales bacterium]
MSPQPLRILHVVLSLDPGGTERLVMDLAERLHAEMPSAVCCLDERGAWADNLASKGISVSALHRQPGFRPALGRRIVEVAKQHQATVLHAHHYSPFVYSAVARLRSPSLRVVFTEHGRLSDAAPSWKRKLANRALDVMPDAVYAVSENLKQHMVAEGFSRRTVRVIYNGIAIGPVPDATSRQRARERLGVGDGDLVIGTIARLDPVKDLGTLLRAVAAMPAQISPVIAVVGDGAERQALTTLATELGMNSRVRWLGQRHDARDWLPGFDLYVNCSISEGVSLTILEAMAAALPVIATRVGGTPEVVDSSCGRLIPARDPAALATALVELAADPQARAALAHAGRARVEERFTIERMVREYADVYRAVTRG